MASLWQKARKIIPGLKMRKKRWEINRRFSSMARQIAEHAPEPKGKPVVVFNASTRLEGMSLNAAFSLLTAWSLRLAGVPVLHFVCERGMKPCVLGMRREAPKQEPPCERCLAQSSAIYAGANTRYFDFAIDPDVQSKISESSVQELETFEYDGYPLGKMVLPALQWGLRRHHLQDDEMTRYFYRQFIFSAWNIIQQFSRALDEVQPQAVVVFNGMFYPEAAARQAALRRGYRVITHEVGIQPGSAFFTDGEATAYPIAIPDDFELTEEQNRILDHLLEQRRQGNFQMAGIKFWRDIQGLDEGFLAQAAKFEQIVPIFTNVIFDTSQGHANVIFPHMFAWLDDVLQIIRAHPETLFIIRAHPDENRPGKASEESVAQWAQRNQVTDLPNVRFVHPDEYLSSYELIHRAKFVMVYNSTIGLEAVLMGTPVLCGGKARFTQLPTVFLPQDISSFHQMAEEFLTAKEVTLPPEFIRNARRFFFYQLFFTSLRFDDFIEDENLWRGFVLLKQFDWQELAPGNSPTMDIIRKGILLKEPFLDFRGSDGNV